MNQNVLLGHDEHGNAIYGPATSAQYPQDHTQRQPHHVVQQPHTQHVYTQPSQSYSPPQQQQHGHHHVQHIHHGQHVHHHVPQHTHHMPQGHVQQSHVNKLAGTIEEPPVKSMNMYEGTVDVLPGYIKGATTRLRTKPNKVYLADSRPVGKDDYNTLLQRARNKGIPLDEFLQPYRDTFLIPDGTDKVIYDDLTIMENITPEENYDIMHRALPKFFPMRMTDGSIPIVTPKPEYRQYKGKSTTNEPSYASAVLDHNNVQEPQGNTVEPFACLGPSGKSVSSFNDYVKDTYSTDFKKKYNIYDPYATEVEKVFAHYLHLSVVCLCRFIIIVNGDDRVKNTVEDLARKVYSCYDHYTLYPDDDDNLQEVRDCGADISVLLDQTNPDTTVVREQENRYRKYLDNQTTTEQEMFQEDVSSQVHEPTFDEATFNSLHPRNFADVEDRKPTDQEVYNFENNVDEFGNTTSTSFDFGGSESWDGDEDIEDKPTTFNGVSDEQVEKHIRELKTIITNTHDIVEAIDNDDLIEYPELEELDSLAMEIELVNNQRENIETILALTDTIETYYERHGTVFEIDSELAGDLRSAALFMSPNALSILKKHGIITYERPKTEIDKKIQRTILQYYLSEEAKATNPTDRFLHAKHIYEGIKVAYENNNTGKTLCRTSTGTEVEDHPDWLRATSGFEIMEDNDIETGISASDVSIRRDTRTTYTFAQEPVYVINEFKDVYMTGKGIMEIKSKDKEVKKNSHRLIDALTAKDRGILDYGDNYTLSGERCETIEQRSGVIIDTYTNDEDVFTGSHDVEEANRLVLDRPTNMLTDIVNISDMKDPENHFIKRKVIVRKDIKMPLDDLDDLLIIFSDDEPLVIETNNLKEVANLKKFDDYITHVFNEVLFNVALVDIKVDSLIHDIRSLYDMANHIENDAISMDAFKSTIDYLRGYISEDDTGNVIISYDQIKTNLSTKDLGLDVFDHRSCLAPETISSTLSRITDTTPSGAPTILHTSDAVYEIVNLVYVEGIDTISVRTLPLDKY